MTFGLHLQLFVEVLCEPLSNLASLPRRSGRFVRDRWRPNNQVLTPILLTLGSGSAINSRIGSKTMRNWLSYFFSHSLSRRARVVFEPIMVRNRTNARMMAIFTSTHIIHGHIYCNRGFATSISLHTDRRRAG